MLLIPLLARAADPPLGADVPIVMAAAGVMAAAAVLAAVPVVVAVRRRHRNREGVIAVAIVWALATAAAVVWAVNRHWSDDAERERQLLALEVNPADPPPPGPTQWPAWAGAAVAYAGLVGWAARGRPHPIAES